MEGLSPLARGKLAFVGVGKTLGGPIPAGAGETRSRSGRPRLSRAYPRWRGGNTRTRCASRRRAGLSPLARGKLRSRRRPLRFAGPIPAGAGETQEKNSPRASIGAYPRWRGGNRDDCGQSHVSGGLSPLARGKPKTDDRQHPNAGPIPAGAGETPSHPPSRDAERAYPRWRGGNPRDTFIVACSSGLSPLARGKPVPPWSSVALRGPIPAGAGETLRTAASSWRGRAYPRWRGGNAHAVCRDWPWSGLSPLARGKRELARIDDANGGPIPAGAGETNHATPPTPAPRAYPRWRGGNYPAAGRWSRGAGLSPLARGKLLLAGRSPAFPGPIPAGAGETLAAFFSSSARRAYPRWRGGNGGRSGQACVASGLSPLARGKPTETEQESESVGPIPAGAGETWTRRASRGAIKAYPRWRGGNGLLQACCAPG